MVWIALPFKSKIKNTTVMAISINEKKITGSWKMVSNEITYDENSLRVFDLISNYLTKINADESGWLELYIDIKDGRYWELSYNNNNLNGGGYPCLTNLSIQEAKIKYKV
ncbi:MAG: Imm27 family immunity protein [Bacteroidia bacterium]